MVYILNRWDSGFITRRQFARVDTPGPEPWIIIMGKPLPPSQQCTFIPSKMKSASLELIAKPEKTNPWINIFGQPSTAWWRDMAVILCPICHEMIIHSPVSSS